MPGTPMSWTVTVTNNGPSDASNVSVTDTAPAGVTFTSASPVLGSCNVTASNVTCDIPNLPATASVDITIIGDLSPSIADGSTLANTASVTSATADPDPSNNSATATTPVEASAELELIKTAAPDPFIAGSPATYTLTVRNVGPSDAAPVTITDQLPAGLSFVSAPGCSETAGVVTCVVATLAVGTETSFTVTADVDPALVGDVVNVATADSPMSDPVDATVTTDVAASADLAVSKSADGPVIAGEQGSWTIVVRNNGTSNATDVSLIDSIPAGMVPVSASTTSGTCSIAGQTVSCDWGSLPTGESRTVSVVVDTDPSLPAGPFTNTATVSAVTPDDPTLSNNSSTAVMDVSRRASVSIRKSGPSSVIAGETITWTFVVRNDGPSSAEAVTVADIAPAGTSWVSAAGATCVQTATLMTCDLGTIAAGGSTSFTLTADVDASVEGASTITNVAQVSTITPDDPSDNSDDHRTGVETLADLSLSKTTDTDVVAGTATTWTIDVANAGPSDAIGLTVSDTLPASVTVDAASLSLPGGSCTVAGQSVTCTIDRLPAAAAAQIVVSGTVDASTADGVLIRNAAEVTSLTSDPDPSNNVDDVGTTVITSADLAVDKSGPSTVVAGNAMVWTISVTNSGPSTAVDVTLEDLIPASVSLVSAVASQGSCTAAVCALGSLVPGGVVTITVTADVPASTTAAAVITNVAEVSSPTSDPDLSDNTDSVDTTVETVADLTVDKTSVLGAAVAGESTSWSITVVNNGPSDALDVVLEDVVPAALVSPTASFLDGTCVAFVCSFARIAPGGLVTVVVSGVVSSSVPDGSTITNTASATSSTTDPDLSDNTSTSMVPVSAAADLSVVKTVLGDVTAGETLSWRLVVSNAGPSDAVSVVVNDSAPAGVVFSAATSTAGSCTVTASTVSCTLGILPAGQDVTIVVDGSLSADAQGSVANTATVTSPTTDPDPTDNTSTVTTVIGTSADLAVSKTLDTAVVAGSAIGWTVTVTNTGPSTARTVTMTDPVPAGMLGASASASTGSCTVASASIECALGDIAVGSTVTITVTGTVDADADPASLLVNVATAVSSTPDPDLTNNVGSATGTVATSADLSIVKAAGANFIAGETASWTIEVSNAGPSTARAVNVSDILPAQLLASSIAATSTTGSCTVSASTVACSLGNLAPGAAASITVTATIDESVTGEITNTATVSSITPDPDPTDNTSTAVAAVSTSADLRTSKTATPNVFTAGTTATYTITVTNLGPSTAAGVTVDDPLPAGLVLVSASTSTGTCTQTSCALGDLRVGQTATITIVVDVDASVADGASLTNIATATSPTSDPDRSNDTGSSINDVRRVADLRISKTAATTGWDAGEPIEFVIEVTNFGPSTSGTFTITDPFPGAPFVTGAAAGCVGVWPADIVCSGSDLAPNGSVRFTVLAGTDQDSLTAPANRATVTQTGASDPDPSNDVASTSVPLATSADLSVVKTAVTPTVLAGEVAEFVIEVTNLGPSTARNVALTENLPSGFTMVAFGACGTASTCVLGDIAPGVTVRVPVSASVAAATPASSLSNTASASSSTNDPTISNNTGSVSIEVRRSADVSVTKSASAATVVAGRSMSWDLVASNVGPSTAESVVVTDILPAGFVFDATQSSAECTADGQVVTCSVGTITPGASFPLVIASSVDSMVVAGSVPNVADVSSTTPDPDPADNTDTATVEVLTVADVSVTKAANGVFVAGSAGSWTITVTNAGPSAARAVQVSDIFPAGFVGTAAVATAGSCTIDAASLECNLGDIDAAASVTITIDGSIDPAHTGEIANTVSVSSPTSDPDPDDNTATAVADVTTAADLEVAKRAAVPAASAGASAAWVVTVTNVGPSAALAVAVSDPHPAGFVASSAASSTGASCTVDPAGVICELGTIAAGETVTISIEGAVIADHIGPVVNTASVTSSTPDPDDTDNTVDSPLDVVAEADLDIVKRSSTPLVANGGRMTWTMTLTNRGPSVARNTVVSDPAQPGFTASAATSSKGTCTVSPAGVSCAAGAVAVGETVTIEVSGHATLSGPVSNTVSASSDATDPTPASSTAVQPVTPTVKLALSKTASKSEVMVGDTVVWTIAVTNAGPDRATNVTIDELLPSGLGSVQMTADLGTVDIAAARWSIPTLEVGASAQMIVTTTVTAAGELVNRVTAASSEIPPTKALVVSASTFSRPLAQPPLQQLPKSGSDTAQLLALAAAFTLLGHLARRGRLL